MNGKMMSPFELIDKMKKFNLQHIPKFNHLMKSLIAAPTVERYELLLKLSNPYFIQDAISPNPFRPSPLQEQCFGPIPIGIVNETSAVFGLSFDDFCQEVAFFGGYKSGKTNAGYLELYGLYKNGIRFVVFDPKLDYRYLIRHIPNLLVLRPTQTLQNSSLLINMLFTTQDLTRHALTLSNQFAESFNFYDGTDNFIFQQIMALYKNFRTQETGVFPTLSELFSRIISLHIPLIKREARYQESAINRLGTLVNTLGVASYYRKGYDLNELLKEYNIIIELSSLSHSVRRFITTICFSQIIMPRFALHESQPVVGLVDEASEIFLREIERKRGMVSLDQFPRKTRGLNIGMSTKSQLPIELSLSVLNANTRFLLSLPEGQNFRYIADSFQLTKEQREVAMQLQPGRAIVKTPRIPTPFLIQMPLFPIQKDVYEEEIENRMAGFINDIRKNVEKKDEHKERAEWKTPSETEPPEEEKSTDEKQEAPIRPEAMQLLMNVCSKPFLTITEHYKDIGLSAGKGNSVLKNAIALGLCKIEEIQTGGRGGASKFIVLTEAGEKVTGVKAKNFSRGGGFVHYYWQQRLSDYLTVIGFKPTIERNMRGKFVDLTIDTPDGIIALEIAMTAVNEKVNVIKDLEAGCRQVIVACKDKTVSEQVQAETGNAFGSKVKICLIADLLKMTAAELVTPEMF